MSWKKREKWSMVKQDMGKEAKARIKINKLLEESSWRFFNLPAEALAKAGDEKGLANIQLEPSVKISK